MAHTGLTHQPSLSLWSVQAGPSGGEEQPQDQCRRRQRPLRAHRLHELQ